MLHNLTTILGVNMETYLDKLARKYQTDKGGNHLKYGGGDSDSCHAYTKVYSEELSRKRFEVKHVLEIGINAGSSLRMWKAYFPSANIVGLDSNAQALIHSEHRIMCLPADQNNAQSLHEAMAKLDPDAPKFDVIIDDGSHEVEHQIVSLVTLLPFLAVGGNYFVEDIGPDTKRTSRDRISDCIPEGFAIKDHHVEGGVGKAACTEILLEVRHEQDISNRSGWVFRKPSG